MKPHIACLSSTLTYSCGHSPDRDCKLPVCLVLCNPGIPTYAKTGEFRPISTIESCNLPPGGPKSRFFSPDRGRILPLQRRADGDFLPVGRWVSLASQGHMRCQTSGFEAIGPQAGIAPRDRPALKDGAMVGLRGWVCGRTKNGRNRSRGRNPGLLAPFQKQRPPRVIRAAQRISRFWNRQPTSSRPEKK